MQGPQEGGHTIAMQGDTRGSAGFCCLPAAHSCRGWDLAVLLIPPSLKQLEQQEIERKGKSEEGSNIWAQPQSAQMVQQGRRAGAWHGGSKGAAGMVPQKLLTRVGAFRFPHREPIHAGQPRGAGRTQQYLLLVLHE